MARSAVAQHLVTPDRPLSAPNPMELKTDIGNDVVVEFLPEHYLEVFTFIKTQMKAELLSGGPRFSRCMGAVLPATEWWWGTSSS